MKKIVNPNKDVWATLLSRPAVDQEQLQETIAEVFKEVRTKGDAAVYAFTKQFDGVALDQLQVSPEEIRAAAMQLNDELKEAIAIAKLNIERFHQAQKTNKVSVETMEGVVCWQEKRPIEKVGLYIPGGTAPLFSTILMLAIPAQLAGCREVVICTPPNKEGGVDPILLYTAQLCGIRTIFKLGGIQAIAAMTLGTQTIPGVYKLFGPGNQFVTAAKQFATKYGVAIDMPAGPSELLVLADGTVNTTFIAADLLSQAEHGPDSQVLFVTTTQGLLNEVEKAVLDQLEKLPRKGIAKRAINNSRLICLPAKEDAMEMVNLYGPEHLIISGENEAFYLENIANAGSVFVGPYTPESAGDYASGTNHTLPTNGFSKQYSGVQLDSFLKAITFQRITKKGLQNIGRTVEVMAEAEGLQAHKNAVSIRLKSIENE